MSSVNQFCFLDRDLNDMEFIFFRIEVTVDSLSSLGVNPVFKEYAIS